MARQSTLTLVLLFASAFINCVTFAELQGKREDFIQLLPKAPSLNDRLLRPASTLRLTNATKPFSVIGTSLPYLHFDIGESYSGFLPIDDDSVNEYFYWFAPSTDPAAQDEVLIWLNGGPGASSLDGFLHANGPFTWQPGTHAPVPNTWTWSNLTNVVWIDQPPGTGYSRGRPNVRSQGDIAKYFLTFWRNFVDLYELHESKVYIAGESYAGKYVPYLADAMISQNNDRYFSLSGILFFNAGIGDDVLQTEVPLASFARSHPHAFNLNASFLAHFAEIDETCGYTSYVSQHLMFPPAGAFPPSLNKTSFGRLHPACDMFVPLFEAFRRVNPCFNIYNIYQPCPIPLDPIGFSYSGHYFPPTFPRPYFDLPTVKHALHVPLDHSWTVTSRDHVFVDGADHSPPSAINGGPLQRVIEHTYNVIVVNGDLDMAVPSDGTLLVLQNLTWNGAQGFSSPPTQWNDLWVPKAEQMIQESIAGAGVMGSWVSERGLTFARVYGAGHQVPEWTPSVAFRQVEVLLGRRKDMGVREGFSTQEWFEGWRQT